MTPFDTVLITGLDKAFHTGIVTLLLMMPVSLADKTLVTTFGTSLVTLILTWFDTASVTAFATELRTERVTKPDTKLATEPDTALITLPASVSDTQTECSLASGFHPDGLRPLALELGFVLPRVVYRVPENLMAEKSRCPGFPRSL